MIKRFAAALVVFLFAMGAFVCAIAEQSVLNWKSGTLFFHDTGIAPEQRVLVLNGFRGRPETRQFLGKRTLQPHEYTLVDTPKGIIGYDIRFDDAFDVSQFDIIEIAIEKIPVEGSADTGPRMPLLQLFQGLLAPAETREWFSIANGFQFVPDSLYLYSIRTNGVAERSVEVAGSFVVNPFVDDFVQQAFMQSIGAHNKDGRQLGLDDSDTLYIASGDYVNFTYTCWTPQNSEPGDLVPMYFFEENLCSLGIGESITLPLHTWPSSSLRPTVTITKEAVLRDGPVTESITESLPKSDVAFPDPIQWPDNAVGQIVVLQNGTNVRQGGSINYNVVGKVNSGDIFFVTGQSASEWYAFEWPDGQTVYIAPSRVEFTLRK
ncbi:MAG: SH3 domain-containing protein [Clostridia bacterium]|nr:SH3 domain-containing protein [Clostridia bacterium]